MTVLSTGLGLFSMWLGGSSICAVWHAAHQQAHAVFFAQAPHAPAQVSAPIYRLAMTTLGGEQRFASAVARRLESLGALTRGDRRAASGVDLSDSNLDSPLGRKCLRRAGPASLSLGSAPVQWALTARSLTLLPHAGMGMHVCTAARLNAAAS